MGNKGSFPGGKAVRA